ALERIPRAATAPGVEVQQVTRPHFDPIALRRQPLFGAVGAYQALAAARAGQPAVHAPGIGEPAIVVNRDASVFEEAVRHANAVAAAVPAGTARIGDALVDLDAQREVRLDVLVGHIGEAGPEAVPVRAVAQRASGDAAEADLE